MVRHRDNLLYSQVRELELPEKRAQDVLVDEITELEGTQAKRKYPKLLRRVAVWNDEHGYTVQLLTNNFKLATPTSLAGTTWKVASIDNADDNFEDWTGATATFNADGTVTFKPDAGWGYTRWTLSDNTLKVVLGETAAADYIEGTLSANGNSATWNCYWADVNGKWTNKDKTHAIMHLQK